ncbi:hypothetical protein FLACOL7796_04742 [Flavobacterium collinsii]|uniref:Uncharacterized protein n=1 Tax=Flavobacterium collinsii TaxID=1114861 RepID=A0ABM8KQD5_9FLAO|nr:hypothetical protein FLACOL7796_04742 [Flavobacterium collinsii]
MLNYILQICVLIFLIYIGHRLGYIFIPNLIIGIVSLMILTNLSFEGTTRSIAEVPIFIFNLFLYVILFFSSLFIYSDNNSEKKHYFIRPIILFGIIVVFELFTLKFDRAFACIFFPISLAFFPLYGLKYYKKY